MTATTQRWADEMKESVEALKALRDEVKLKLHLANMDAKVKLEQLEHRLDTQQLNVKKTMHEMAAEFRLLRDELTREAKAADAQKDKKG